MTASVMKELKFTCHCFRVLFLYTLRSKSMDWFLYDNGLRQERVNLIKLQQAQLQSLSQDPRKYLRCSLPEQCSYSEFFWSAFSHIRTKYREIRNISPHSLQIQENTDQNNSDYGHIHVVVGVNCFSKALHYREVANRGVL